MSISIHHSYISVFTLIICGLDLVIRTDLFIPLIPLTFTSSTCYPKLNKLQNKELFSFLF